MKAGCACSLCSRQWHRDHTAAILLLQQAEAVAKMPKAVREKFWIDAKAARGEAATRDLLAVVNTIRARDRGTTDAE